MYQLEVLIQALAELNAYIERKVGQISAIEKCLRGGSNYNHRQLAMLSHALRHPGAKLGTCLPLLFLQEEIDCQTIELGRRLHVDHVPVPDRVNLDFAGFVQVESEELIGYNPADRAP